MHKSELKSLLTESASGTPSGRIVRVLSERGALSGNADRQHPGPGEIDRLDDARPSCARRAWLSTAPRPRRGRSAGAGRPAMAVMLNPLAGTCVGLLLGLEHMQLIVADVSHAVLDRQDGPASRPTIRRTMRSASSSDCVGGGLCRARHFQRHHPWRRHRRRRPDQSDQRPRHQGRRHPDLGRHRYPRHVRARRWSGRSMPTMPASARPSRR